MTTTRLIEETGTGINNYKRYEIVHDSSQIQTLVTASPSQVGYWLARNTRKPYELLVVGLDVEWRPNTSRNMQNPVATLQLCVESGSCLIFQILHAPLIPRSLVSFLANPDIIFAGVGVEDDAAKLLRDYNLRVANPVDLRAVAAEELEMFHLRLAGLSELSYHTLDLDYEKPHNITMSRWDNRVLTDQQVEYAAMDAFLSCQIGCVLIS